MLPVATPPNAIVFSSGLIPMGRMASIGVFMNFMGAFLVLLVIEFLAKAVLGIESGVLPSWATDG
jgi:sodium-dependent dicarboxylate transporter 2/3/5